ncbi:MAG: STAS/SEC14 domain-containing protein [Bermanella sp.]|nr:STAS/SEC14 domain-containing protein [Bermanella sp.]|tara:strand:- start:2022 stop:2414 length:393 start_codon:yes stop_codon:yes gene_type:complete
MVLKTHGLTIGIERVENDIFISLKAVGTLTHDDYLAITPLIERALEAIEHPNVDVLFDATQLDGWELRAAWDDLKLGLKHGKAFQNVAICGNKRWLQVAAKVGSWFISGDVKYFDDIQEALQWITNSPDE